MLPEQLAQAALALAGENLGKQRVRYERRMTALPVEARIGDRRPAHRERLRQRGDRFRTHQRDVDREKEARIDRRQQGVDARLDAGIHALLEVHVAHNRDAEAIDDRLDLIGSVSRDDADALDARSAEHRDDLRDNRGAGNRQ